MRKYVCTIKFKCSDWLEISSWLSMVMPVLGFDPKFMDIFFDEFTKPLNDISFDAHYLTSLLKKQPSTINIVNKLYDENNPGSCYSFALKTNTDENFTLQTCSLSWLNSSLNFLLTSNVFELFLKSKKMIYCYCYDQYDVHKQSDTSRINPHFGKSPNFDLQVNEFILHDVDISKNWGRVVSVRGMSFMAAPLMWFGGEFFKIISENKLMGFDYATLIKYDSYNVVQVILFDLYNDPSISENRARQKNFWLFFDLIEEIKKYENSSQIDAIAWLKARAAAKKKK